MRPFAEQMTDAASLADPYMREVACALEQIAPIADTLVPDTSLIREFIPGGKYEYLY